MPYVALLTNSGDYIDGSDGSNIVTTLIDTDGGPPASTHQFLTYFDAVEHMISASFGGPQDAEQKDIRTALQRAYREVATIRDWRYYHTHGRIVFNARWEGSVTYDEETRRFTRVTGDPFPLHAANCSLRVNNVVVRIAQRINGNTLVADPVVRFPTDLLTPTTALLYQSLYRLPADFRNIDTPMDQNKWTYFTFVEPDMAMKIESTVDLQGPPNAWTVIKDPYSSGWAVKVIGYPITVETLDFTYRRLPRGLRISGHEASSRGGVVTAAGLSLTGTATQFTPAMVGSVIRFGTPEALPDTLGSMQPYEAESRIVSVSSPTSATLASEVNAAGVRYVITDILDMPDSMHNALLSCAEYWLARMRGTKPENAYALYQRDLRLAMEGDQLAPYSGTQRVIWDTSGWRTPLQSDNFDGGRP
jgi:hypothetical protein